MILRNRMMLGVAVLVGWLGFASGASAQFPSERYRKVTAEQMETKALKMPTDAGEGRVLTSDESGNAAWLRPIEPPDVGWHKTDDGNNITSLYRRLVVGGPEIGDERLLVQGYSGEDYVGDLIEPSYANQDGTWCFASSGVASKSFDNSMNSVWMPTDEAPWVALRFMDGSKQVNWITLHKYRDDDGQGVIRFPWDEFAAWGSNNSTNGVDGDWTPISPTFTIQHVSERSHSYDFSENRSSFEWIKLAGARSTQPAKLWLHEVEAFTFAPTPARRFFVDAEGNPGTDGTMSAATVQVTSGTQTAWFDADDVARWLSLQDGITTETDPVFMDSAASAISGQDIEAWNSFVVNNAWLTHPNYPTEVLTFRSLNLSRGFGSDNRLLVQGYREAGWSSNLALDLASLDPQIRDQHLFTNLPVYQNPHYAMFDHRVDTIWTYYNQPMGISYWIAYKFDVPTQVNRVRHYKYGGWGNPWPSFTVWGSNDSTNGANGAWTQLSGELLLGTTFDAVTNCDFLENTRRFLWVKIVGSPKTKVEGIGVREIEFESFESAPDKRFWVDAHGNPGTDGFMSVGSVRFDALDSSPDDPAPGTAFFDNLSRKLRVWDGSTWQDAW